MTDAAVTEILTCLGDVTYPGDLVQHRNMEIYLVLSPWTCLGRTQQGYDYHINEYWFECKVLALPANKKTSFKIAFRKAEQFQEKLKDFKVVSRP